MHQIEVLEGAFTCPKLDMKEKRNDHKNMEQQLVERELQLRKQLGKIIELDCKCEKQAEIIKKLIDELNDHVKYGETIRNQLLSTYSSHSWRITTPVRTLSNLVRSLLQGRVSLRIIHTENIIPSPRVSMVSGYEHTSVMGSEKQKQAPVMIEDVEQLENEIRYWRIQTMSLLEDLEHFRLKKN